MQEKSDRAQPRQDTAMTVCACGNFSLHSGHLLLTHTCRSQTLTVRAFTWNSLLCQTARSIAVWVSLLYVANTPPGVDS